MEANYKSVQVVDETNFHLLRDCLPYDTAAVDRDDGVAVYVHNFDRIVRASHVKTLAMQRNGRCLYKSLSVVHTVADLGLLL